MNLPTMQSAFRTTSVGGQPRYVMTFAFASLDDLNAADAEWRAVCASDRVQSTETEGLGPEGEERGARQGMRPEETKRQASAPQVVEPETVEAEIMSLVTECVYAAQALVQPGSIEDHDRRATRVMAADHALRYRLHQALRASAPSVQVVPTGRAHELKTDPEVFDAVASGAKTHEIRFNDRDFCVGDRLVLLRTESTGEAMRAGAPLVYTGQRIERVVSHVLSGYGLAEGWVILSFAQALPAAQQPAPWTRVTLEERLGAQPAVEPVAPPAGQQGS